MKTYHTIIIGAGSSGIAAAMACAKGGQRVLLIDRCDQIGKKILVTGNGKCNLTNLRQCPECYRGEAPAQIGSIFSAFGLEETMQLFRQAGILTREKNGYVYPYNEQAACVREAFESVLLSKSNLKIMTDTSVEKIKRQKDIFIVGIKHYCHQVGTGMHRKKQGMPIAERYEKKQDYVIKKGYEKEQRLVNGKGCNRGKSFSYNGGVENGQNPTETKEYITCQSLIIATGGLAGPRLGCDGSGYDFAREMGHHIIKPLPSLTALKSSAPFLKKVSGVRNQARITLFVDGANVAEERGELQWTDYGISGVAVFQVSRYAVLALEEKQSVRLVIDFMPEYEKNVLEHLLDDSRNRCSYKTGQAFLNGYVAAKLSPVLLREARIVPDVVVSQWSQNELQAIVRVMKGFVLKINGYVGYENPHVTQGGVDLNELTDTLESCLCPGLFFAGEVVDVDGICGGYNLQWAFSSGSVAGESAFRRNERKTV
ncbi:MAG: aminoacetone oxidase family FAD-binding enzyme [Clostridiales bacterium]|nr:aminoacetone oxidase family FAD-binding enzyme [Clostridiales bacterium]